jgi:hypothetical protein
VTDRLSIHVKVEGVGLGEEQARQKNGGECERGAKEHVASCGTEVSDGQG